MVWYSNRQRRWDITERVTTGGSAWSSFAHVLAADVFFLHNQYIHNNYLYFGIEQSTYAHYKCLSLGWVFSMILMMVANISVSLQLVSHVKC